MGCPRGPPLRGPQHGACSLSPIWRVCVSIPPPRQCRRIPTSTGTTCSKRTGQTAARLGGVSQNRPGGKPDAETITNWGMDIKGPGKSRHMTQSEAGTLVADLIQVYASARLIQLADGYRSAGRHSRLDLHQTTGRCWDTRRLITLDGCWGARRFTRSNWYQASLWL